MAIELNVYSFIFSSVYMATHVVVTASERPAVCTTVTPGQISIIIFHVMRRMRLLMLIVLMMNHECGVDHCYQCDGNVTALTVDAHVHQEHGYSHQPSTTCGSQRRIRDETACSSKKPFDAHCCHMGTAIKHPMSDRVKLRAKFQSARMSKFTNDGLTWSGTGCFMAVPIWQQWASKG